MAGDEHRETAHRRILVKHHRLVVLACVLCWGAPAQTNAPTNAVDLSGLLGAVQEWAEENLDENLLVALGELDQQRVEQFLRRWETALGGEYVLDMAALKDSAKAVLPVLDAHEETQPYAAWVKSRVDYFDAAEELRRAMPPPPKPEPGQPLPPPTHPSPVLQRRVWEKQLGQRPLPKGAEALVPRLKAVFVSERVPAQLVWLAEVESAFDRRARSPVGAAGLFQIMPTTAKRFGLRRWPFDQRCQVEPSAQAAARYLRTLHAQFRDWSLALAAYNAGEGTVGRLLAKHKAQSFDGIASHLPAETQMYVPKVEATLLRREGVRLHKLPAPQT